MAEKKTRGRGRPAGSKDNSRSRPRRDPLEQFHRDVCDVGLIAFYGATSTTYAIIDVLWNDPNLEFIATDPVEQRVANLTRYVGAKPWSLYRYEQQGHRDFVTCGRWPVIVTTEEWHDRVVRESQAGTTVILDTDILPPEKDDD